MDFSKFFDDMVLAPLIAFFIPIMWKLSSIPINLTREYFMRKTSLIEIDLNIKLDSESFKNATFKCLLIRFGTDKYIKDMASDREKHDGRLRNKTIEGLYNNGKVIYSIPLHKRIGTQFKCYLEVPTKQEALDLEKKQMN